MAGLLISGWKNPEIADFWLENKFLPENRRFQEGNPNMLENGLFWKVCVLYRALGSRGLAVRRWVASPPPTRVLAQPSWREQRT